MAARDSIVCSCSLDSATRWIRMFDNRNSSKLIRQLEPPSVRFYTGRAVTALRAETAHTGLSQHAFPLQRRPSGLLLWRLLALHWMLDRPTSWLTDMTDH